MGTKIILTQLGQLSRRRRFLQTIELHPRGDWHKGKTLLLLMEMMGIDKGGVFPLYPGDDLPDEDVFRALQGRGVGFLLEEGGRPTAAHYSLRNPKEVQIFLRNISSMIRGKENG
jgi:trehalose-phosphatase